MSKHAVIDHNIKLSAYKENGVTLKWISPYITIDYPSCSISLSSGTQDIYSRLDDWKDLVLFYEYFHGVAQVVVFLFLQEHRIFTADWTDDWKDLVLFYEYFHGVT